MEATTKIVTEIRALDSKIIVTRTDGQTTNGQGTNFDFMSSADIVKQS